MRRARAVLSSPLIAVVSILAFGEASTVPRLTAKRASTAGEAHPPHPEWLPPQGTEAAIKKALFPDHQGQ
jgi:hypothetical protein